MNRIIAVANQKGGVGKTTTCVNLCGYLARQGKKVLLVDIDPQGNASSGLGLATEDLERTIYHMLLGDISAAEAIVSTNIAGLDILPANVHLSGIEVDMLGMEEREFLLKGHLAQVAARYDFVYIDCPPNLGILTLNALSAAQGVLITLQTEYYALEGLTQLMKVIQLVQQNLNPALRLEGVVLTMYDSRTALANQVTQDVRNHFQELVYESVIPRNVRLSEAPSFGKFIGDYAPESSGAQAYARLAMEVLRGA
ncbi:MAG: ParA family protein [Spirochaetales bacterium]|nr:ParA family protein [Spirochaetales bacterium]